MATEIPIRILGFGIAALVGEILLILLCIPDDFGKRAHLLIQFRGGSVGGFRLGFCGSQMLKSILQGRVSGSPDLGINFGGSLQIFGVSPALQIRLVLKSFGRKDDKLGCGFLNLLATGLRCFLYPFGDAFAGKIFAES